MGKIILIVAGVLLVIVILVPVGIYYGSDVRNRKIVPPFPDAQTPVKGVTPMSLTQVRARLIKKWGAEFSGPNSFADLSHPEYGPQFRQFTVLPNENGNINGQFRATDTGFSSDAPISTKGIDLEAEAPNFSPIYSFQFPSASTTYRYRRG